MISSPLSSLDCCQHLHHSAGASKRSVTSVTAFPPQGSHVRDRAIRPRFLLRLCLPVALQHQSPPSSSQAQSIQGHHGSVSIKTSSEARSKRAADIAVLKGAGKSVCIYTGLAGHSCQYILLARTHSLPAGHGRTRWSHPSPRSRCGRQGARPATRRRSMRKKKPLPGGSAWKTESHLPVAQWPVSVDYDLRSLQTFSDTRSTVSRR